MNARKSIIALGLVLGSIGTMVATPAAADIYVRIAPPAPRYEVAPVLQPGWDWAPGYWGWNGNRYYWVKGHRVRAQRGAHWVPHRWVQDRGRGRMENGHWDNRRNWEHRR